MIDLLQLSTSRLTDSDLKRLFIVFTSMASDDTVGLVNRRFYYDLAKAIQAVVRRRERAVALMETDAMNTIKMGALIEPGDDPVADALAELRREPGTEGED